MMCLNCNKQFKPKRKDAKFCSASCRVKYSRTVTDNNRTINVTDNNVTDNNVTDNNVTDNVRDNVTLKNGTLKRPKNETDKDRIGKAIQGYCHGCGRNIKTIKGLTTDGSMPDNEMANRICICFHCINKGKTHKNLGMKMCEA